MGPIYSSLLLLLAFLSSYGRINDTLKQIDAGTKPTTPTQQQIEKGFIKAAELIHARAPIMVDEGTRLDKAIAGPGVGLTSALSRPRFIPKQFSECGCCHSPPREGCLPRR